MMAIIVKNANFGERYVEYAIENFIEWPQGCFN